MIPDPIAFPGNLCTVVNPRRPRAGKAAIEEGMVTSATYQLGRYGEGGRWVYRVALTRKSHIGATVNVLIRRDDQIRNGGMTDEEKRGQDGA
jgi:hypothetical protein